MNGTTVKVHFRRRDDHGYLDARISNGRTANKVQGVQPRPFFFWNDERISDEDSLVPILVHAKSETSDFSVLECIDPVVGELSNAAGQARRKTTGRHHGNVHVFSFKAEVCHFGVEAFEQDVGT